MAAPASVSCPSCGGSQTIGKGPYLYSTEEQRSLGCAELRLCGSCGLGFAAPMPSAEGLRSFYRDAYRRDPLSPYRYSAPLEAELPPQVLPQLEFMGRGVGFRGLRMVGEIGCGYGFLLRELLRRHPRLKAFAIEEDLEASRHLPGFGIAVNPRPVPKADLCIASHCLEHFTAPGPFFELVESMEPEQLFIEVPNTEGLSEEFLARAYDSPHLLFFSVSSLSDTLRRNGWTPLAVDTAGYGLREELELLRSQKLLMQRLGEVSAAGRTLAEVRMRGKAFLKGVLPSAALQAWRRLKPGAAEARRLDESWGAYGGARVVIRALARRDGR